MDFLFTLGPEPWSPSGDTVTEVVRLGSFPKPVYFCSSVCGPLDNRLCGVQHHLITWHGSCCKCFSVNTHSVWKHSFKAASNRNLGDIFEFLKIKYIFYIYRLGDLNLLSKSYDKLSHSCHFIQMNA